MSSLPGPVPAPQPPGAVGGPPEAAPSLWRARVVVDLLSSGARSGPDSTDGADRADRAGGAAAAVLAALPLEQLPAMADDGAREGAVTAASDGSSLELVLLVEALTDVGAEEAAVRAARSALRGAGLGPDDALTSQVVVAAAYAP